MWKCRDVKSLAPIGGLGLRIVRMKIEADQHDFTITGSGSAFANAKVAPQEGKKKILDDARGYQSIKVYIKPDESLNFLFRLWRASPVSGASLIVPLPTRSTSPWQISNSHSKYRPCSTKNPHKPFIASFRIPQVRRWSGREETMLIAAP